MDLPHVRAVLRQLPTHMMWDDHELDDQFEPGMWRNKPSRKWDQRTALRTFHQWQRLSGTDFPYSDTKDSSYNPWSELYPAGYPFFLLNTRTHRSRQPWLPGFTATLLGPA
jgi:phosphodiesterase/alkaline phosphatase D-like protein